MLLALGAILYFNTNLPQSIKTRSSNDEIFGRTSDPCNELSAAVGSTGGNFFVAERTLDDLHSQRTIYEMEWIIEG